MVSKRDKKLMSDFLAARIEEAERYDIKQKDDSHILIAQKSERSAHPKQAYIILHNIKMPIKKYRALVQHNSRKKIYTSDIFYKDNKNFMVWLGARGNFKGDERSLKNYDKKDRDKMVHLRGLEKAALAYQHDPVLVYFQPETSRLEESLRGYHMKPVRLDYSHIQPGDQGYGFARPDISIDYKIAEELFNIQEVPVQFNTTKGMSLIMVPKGSKIGLRNR